MMAADDMAPEQAVPQEDAVDQKLVDIPEPFTGDFPIRVKGLRNAFGDQVIHEGLDLDVRRGEIIGVVGGSGTGKSVLMRSIIGLQIPEEGTIEVLGRSITDARDDDDIDIRSRWGVLFQGGALFSTLTVGENVEVPLKEFYPEIHDELRHEIARYKVLLSGLPANATGRYPSQLSGGMRKRAGLARALSLDPEVLFLDEPTAGLDPIGAAAFDTLIAELQQTLDLTVFLITHDLDTLYEICDRVAVIADKKVIAVGTIPELLATDHPWIQEYFNGPRGRAAQDSQKRGRAAQDSQKRGRAARDSQKRGQVAQDGQKRKEDVWNGDATQPSASEPTEMDKPEQQQA